MRISAVIPTRNRAASLKNILQSLLSQTRCPDEVVVVDSSDDKDSIENLKKEFQGQPVLWIDSSPAVCLQRNTGVRIASGDWIFLCDDDMELEPNYLETLESHVKNNTDCGVVAGRLVQMELNGWADQYPVKSFGDLFWRFMFQLSIWGAVNRFRMPVALRPVYYLLKRFYHWRGNTLSLAGWPLITQWEKEKFQTTIYSLGANLVRKDWLCHAEFDEVLDPSGIGDNYGVALSFPGEKAIHVLGTTYAYHHRANENRLDSTLAYYRRILALHYFIKKHNPSSLTKTIFLAWSLLGNSLMFSFKGDFKLLKATCKATMLIITGKNPYWLGYLKNKKTVQPFL